MNLLSLLPMLVIVPGIILLIVLPGRRRSEEASSGFDSHILHICPQCGNILERNWGFCPFCGADVIAQTEEIRQQAEIVALPYNELLRRYGAVEEYSKDYRTRCYEELLKRQANKT